MSDEIGLREVVPFCEMYGTGTTLTDSGLGTLASRFRDFISVKVLRHNLSDETGLREAIPGPSFSSSHYVSLSILELSGTTICGL